MIQDTIPSLPFDDAAADDILVDVFRFLTYDQLKACCAALPHWKTVFDGKRRLMPREPLRCVKVSWTGIITVESDLDFGPSPSLSTRSKAPAKGRHKCLFHR